MNLSESIALKAKGSNQVSSLGKNVQAIRNKQQKSITPGKAPGQASVDKSTSQF